VKFLVWQRERDIHVGQLGTARTLRSKGLSIEQADEIEAPSPRDAAIAWAKMSDEKRVEEPPGFIWYLSVYHENGRVLKFNVVKFVDVSYEAHRPVLKAARGDET